MSISLSDRRKMKSAIEKLKCKEHGEHPAVTFSGDKVNISCCCEAFRAKCIEAYKDVLAEYTKEQILKAFKGRK